MFKTLRTFQTVYEMKNFSKAAEKLFISQPAVSNHIKQLEDELAVVLFTRNGRQEIFATKQADSLYQHLLDFEDDWEELVQGLHNVDVPKEVCKISASNTFAIYYLPELMSKLTASFPDISFVLAMENSEQVVEKLQKHGAHFGFIEKPLVTAPLTRKKIISDQLVRAGNLEDELWLVREESSGVYHYTKRFFAENNLAPNELVVENNELIIKLLEQGLGQSIISKKAVTNHLSWLALGNAYERNFYFVKKETIKSKRLQQIGEWVEKYY